ncbi:MULTISPECIES: flagellar export chaperone FliS [Psychrobacillus]|uniref:Flagellar secretion chaperone FliS n=1 Tax=Psychrobacillus lasiicapitis TaxID=1636719 RepID=A0A544TE41_9BACI|nr:MULTISPECIES: flagellar export chaperone FliS [Psychrobacillus]MDI2589731.1 flagellar export chaperone FliS [Psychrobacillus sp. NEAU-3TGS]TQR15727.1 flagellar export chaperone FliS [Psychrobacillus lasiicapitis]GGA18519.1 flagellar protein FliS [Psychrobacillus lasiicapitis]
MAVNNPYKAYQQNSVTQSTPGELTLMLYNGCLKFLNQAKKGIETKDIELKNTNIQKAQNILRELMITLDMSVAVSASMASLYEYMINRLVEANIQNDTAKVDEVIGYTTEFRDTWKQVIQINRQKQYGQTGEV